MTSLAKARLQNISSGIITQIIQSVNGNLKASTFASRPSRICNLAQDRLPSRFYELLTGSPSDNRRQATCDVSATALQPKCCAVTTMIFDENECFTIFVSKAILFESIAYHIIKVLFEDEE